MCSVKSAQNILTEAISIISFLSWERIGIWQIGCEQVVKIQLYEIHKIIRRERGNLRIRICPLF
jgi:hypothetical protein